MKRSSIFIVNDTSFSFNKQLKLNFDGVGFSSDCGLFLHLLHLSYLWMQVLFCLVENKEEVW